MGSLEKDTGKTKGGQSWVRAYGPNTEPWHLDQAKVNKTRFEAPDFKTACESAGIPATKRQASKWNNGKGAAYKTANKIAMNGFAA